MKIAQFKDPKYDWHSGIWSEKDGDTLSYVRISEWLEVEFIPRTDDGLITLYAAYLLCVVLS